MSNFALAGMLIVSLAAADEGLPSLRVQPGAARPGDPVLITVNNVHRAPQGTLGKKRLRFVPFANGFLALTALPVEQAGGPLDLAIQLKEKRSPDGGMPSELDGTLDVLEANFPSRELKVDNKFIHPPKDVKQRIAEDKAAFATAFGQPFGPLQFSSNFAWPRPPVITAPFGDLRLFNGEKKSQHYGTDLDGKAGDPIYAANDGTVVLTRDCYASGNTTLVSHGAGLYTAYFHQSKMLVKNGERVKQGQRIGLVGKTGRVTGPHLHWGVKLDGIYVNGVSLISLDFE